MNTEVTIKVEDKERLIKLITEAHSILEKYPFFGEDIYYVTTMSRAKSAVNSAKEFVEIIPTE